MLNRPGTLERKRYHPEITIDNPDKYRKSGLDRIKFDDSYISYDTDKRARREIANSNERRRMQSINTGFQSLRMLLPYQTDGDKISKATVLQLAVDYIQDLVRKVSTLESQLGLNQNTIQPFIDTPSLTPSVRKRRINVHSVNRGRRRRMETDEFGGASADSEKSFSSGGSFVQSSPCASSGSTSISPISPHPDSGCSASGRLEHLVMAIEQIEGSRSLADKSETEVQYDPYSVCERSDHFYPFCQTNEMQHAYFDYNTSNIENHAIIYPAGVTLSNENVDTSLPDVDSSIDQCSNVAKLLNKHIPHKYLHRPQVVVNSTL